MNALNGLTKLQLDFCGGMKIILQVRIYIASERSLAFRMGSITYLKIPPCFGMQRFVLAVTVRKICVVAGICVGDCAGKPSGTAMRYIWIWHWSPEEH